MEILTRYRRKQFIILSLFFIFCASAIYIADYRSEKKLILDNLNNNLNQNAEFLNNLFNQKGLFEKLNIESFDSIVGALPDKNTRITIIDLNGKVIYDSKVEDIGSMQNHGNRPEIINSKSRPFGSDIRISVTNQLRYYYFAKKFKNYYIRISIEYNLKTSQLFEPEKFPILVTLILFFISTVFLLFINDKFGKSLIMLKNFTLQASGKHSEEKIIKFPKNELGNIGKDIVNIYDKLNKAKSDLISEKEKLIRHLNLLDEGIAIFTKEKRIIANNSNFIQYISLVSDQQIYSPENFFEIDAFNDLYQFIDTNIQLSIDQSIKQKFYEVNINIDSRILSAKSIVFQDKSIEIIIRDITKPARRKILKQQLTENIAHELKTPVSSIKGFLETIIEIQPDKEKIYYFIKKAYSQTCRLADLINDISLLTKIEEASSLYPIEKVNIKGLVNNVIDDIDQQIKDNNIEVNLNIPANLECNGNPTLLYSVFRNLFDNAISYAGRDLTLRVENYMEDEDFYYFSFSDNGIGVPEYDLTRLFERFYRVDKGREHKKGGTGLGLAIVKNAILFHAGEISVKNRKDGGLEFLFSIKK